MATGVSAQIYIPVFDLQGHRGARGLRPENTIPAFIIALDSGVTTVELDVAITRDKRIVVSHEPWMSASICQRPDGSAISEKEEKSFNLYEMNYDDIAKFDCGSKGNEKFPEQVTMKVAKPLLEDVIIAIEHHIKSHLLYEVDYNIEIKSSPAGDDKFHPKPEVFSDLVYNLIDQYLPMERVVIQSFDFRVLKYWHKKYPDIRLAALIENTKTVDANLKSLGFQPSVYSPNFKLLTKEKIDYLKGKRIRVIPWTVNEIEDMQRMLKWKVDGFITDYPDRAATLGLGIKRSDSGGR
ncbi:MAG TPA: glycerophosphodiester phosphodiesterase [Chryseosolibacter sp.]|nr:glycerophosphodiester phosphodiesterase [Chryseosolibacter sp.]